MPTTPQLLPTVDWQGRQITRLLLGHNPFKAQSHGCPQLDAEMQVWFDPAAGNDLALLARAEACGINTCQFGAAAMHDRLQRYHAGGGHLQWIATLYDSGSSWTPEAPSCEAEVQQILAVDPPPLGLMNFGENTDRYFLSGQMPRLREKLKRLRETGLLIGVGTHLPQVIEVVEEQGWDVDFYQTCCYTVYANVDEHAIDRSREVYDDAARDRMLAFVGQASKPCIAFKVLKANRLCGSPAEVKAALAYAFERIKPCDVVCVGMWNKYLDQVAQNCRFVREILGAASPS